MVGYSNFVTLRLTKLLFCIRSHLWNSSKETDDTSKLINRIGNNWGCIAMKYLIDRVLEIVLFDLQLSCYRLQLLLTVAKVITKTIY